ncbi:MAG: signal peptidase I [Chloroflexi bacterium]|nr:signal peptidase I [Chloroflexota bacterium]
MVSLAGHSAASTPADEPGLASRIWMGFAVALLLLGFGLMGLRLAGFQFISIRGHSMEPTFSPGALLIARAAPPETVQAGDIIAFSGMAGEPNIVHRVVALRTGSTPVATTMGDNNPVIDPYPVVLRGPVPRIIGSVPQVGWWFTPDVGRRLLAVSALLAALVAVRQTGRLIAERVLQRRSPRPIAPEAAIPAPL